MSSSEWAKHEVELACKREAQNSNDGDAAYGCFCYKSALKAFLAICEDRHSGMTFGFTKQILIRMLNDCPLTPIEDNEEDWWEAWDSLDGIKHYQCKRMGRLFKEVLPDGTVRYSENNYYCVDEITGTTYTGCHAADVLAEYVEPITMPYMPEEKKYEIHTMEYLTDRRNGDFDTKVYLYIICPSGEKVYVNRYFAETGNGWQEIGKHELKRRIRMHTKRELKELKERRGDPK